jgi:hypothetical protein
VPLVRAVGRAALVDESPARGRFPVEAQRQLGIFVAGEIGFDWAPGGSIASPTLLQASAGATCG